jgi:hypothetical protein
MPDMDPTSSAIGTGITTLTLFGLLVALTKWIGGNFAKEVMILNSKLDMQTVEHKKEIAEIRIAHDDCLKKHNETALALATLKGRMSAVEGQHDKN